MEKDQFERITEYLQRLDGNVMAAQAAIRGLVMAMPDRAAAAQIVNTALAHAEASMLAHAVPEAMVEGFGQGWKRMLPGELGPR